MKDQDDKTRQPHMIKTPAKIICFSILVIEANQSQTPLLRETLEADSHHVKTAHSGEAALELLASYMPQLILADLALPDMTGLELLQLLKPILPNVPVMFLTEPNAEFDIEQGLALGAEDFILRPWRPNALLRRIREILLGDDAGEKAAVAVAATSGASQKTFHGVLRQLLVPPEPGRNQPGSELSLWLQLRGFRTAAN